MATMQDILLSGDQRAWYAQQAQNQNAAAQTAIQQGQLQLAREQFAWAQKLNTAAQTGKWDGSWSFPSSQYFTNTFGTWMGEGGYPGEVNSGRAGAGAQSLEAQNQTYNQMMQMAQMYGQYYSPGQVPTAGTATQASIQQAADIANQQGQLTGWYTAPGVGTGSGGTGGAVNMGTGYFVGSDHRIHQGSPGNLTGVGSPGWDPDIPGGGSGRPADPSWAVGTQVSDPNMLLKPTNDPSVIAANGGQQPGVVAGPGQQQRTLAGSEQDFTQALRGMQEARAAQGQQQNQAAAYLTLLSQLRGPADWAKYQQVLGATPGGMRDLVASAMGQYVPGGGATTGYQPQAASLQSMMGDVSGNPYYGQGGGQLNMPNVYNQNTSGMYYQQPGYGQQQGGQNMYGTPTMGAQQQPYYGGGTDPNQAYQQYYKQYAGGYGQQPGTGQNMYGTPTMGSQQTWGSGIGVGQQQPSDTQQMQGYGNGYNLPAPNQISAQAWNNLQPSQKQMLLGMYEAGGWDKTDVENLRNQSLPKYATNTATAGTWRM